MWRSAQITLLPRERGIHLVTADVVEGLGASLQEISVGLCHLHLAHTSAALTLNENASPEVRGDLERWLDRAAPDGAPFFRHTLEGPDDMAAHVKASLLGVGLLLPVRDGRLALGTWQGIQLVEARDRGGARRILATVWGEGR